MRTGTAVTAVSRAPHICPFVMQECKQADVQLTVIRCGLFLPSRPLSIFALVSQIQKNSPPIFATSFGKTSVRLCFETQKHRPTFFSFLFFFLSPSVVFRKKQTSRLLLLLLRYTQRTPNAGERTGKANPGNNRADRLF